MNNTATVENFPGNTGVQSHTLWTRLTATTQNSSLFVLRITLALVMFPHGAQKLFGWFGGYGFEGTMGFFTETMGIPWIFGFLAIMAESVGALALLFGFMGRLSAFGIGFVILVAMLTSHLDYGFFMNWSGAQAGEGLEYHLLVIGMSIALIIGGSGAWSVDRKLSQ